MKKYNEIIIASLSAFAVAATSMFYRDNAGPNGKHSIKSPIEMLYEIGKTPEPIMRCKVYDHTFFPYAHKTIEETLSQKMKEDPIHPLPKIAMGDMILQKAYCGGKKSEVMEKLFNAEEWYKRALKDLPLNCPPQSFPQASFPHDYVPTQRTSTPQMSDLAMIAEGRLARVSTLLAKYSEQPDKKQKFLDEAIESYRMIAECNSSFEGRGYPGIWNLLKAAGLSKEEAKGVKVEARARKVLGRDRDGIHERLAWRLK